MMAATKNYDPEKSLKKVMTLYGAALFLGLAISIYTHHIEDVGGFLTFLVPAAIIYFFVLFAFFKEGMFRKIVYGLMAFIGLVSVFMAFYLELTGGGH
ncbi:hypothetical protein [Planococcus maritimus]|uniref:hypothetical protein n=1 Tax=Planococcus maritimus TaxID=192421 RepID=UPI00232CDA9B|nr:hypothetical protein [Planococcus maritimus]